MNLQAARDHVANARSYATTDFETEVASALETLGTAVEAMLKKLDQLEGRVDRQDRSRPDRFLSF